MEENMITKRCPKCGRELSIEAFNKCSSTKDGLQTHCRECQTASQRACRLRRRESSSRMNKVYGNPELAKFQPRELIAELKARGYSGELTYTQRIAL